MGVLTKILSSKSFLACNKSIARWAGLNEAVLFAELCHLQDFHEQSDSLDSEGYFYRTSQKLFEETTLTERQQKPCLDNLSIIGFVKMKLKGNPAKRHYKIDDECEINIIKKMQEWDNKPLLDSTKCRNKIRHFVETRFDILSKQDSTKCRNKNQQNVETIKEKKILEENKEKKTIQDSSKNSDEFSESIETKNKEVKKTASKQKKEKASPPPKKERAKTWIDLAMGKFNERCAIEAKARNEEFTPHTFPNFAKEAGNLGKLRITCIYQIFKEITNADDTAVMTDEIFLTYFDAYVLKSYRYFASIASNQGGQNNISFVSMINKYDQIKQTISKVKKKSAPTPLSKNYDDCEKFGEKISEKVVKYNGFTVHV